MYLYTSGPGAYAACENALSQTLFYACFRMFSSIRPHLNLFRYDTCNLCELFPVTGGGTINPYDIREGCKVPPLCYDFSDVDKFYNLESTIKGLGAEVEKWVECNRAVELELVFAGDWMKDFAEDIPVLLAGGKQVLIYHGIWDYIVNWIGGYYWVERLEWPHKKEWNAAKNETWTVDGKTAGFSQSFANLTFLQVLGAGHLVPMDQPENALDMIQRLITGQGW